MIIYTYLSLSLYVHAYKVQNIRLNTTPIIINIKPIGMVVHIIIDEALNFHCKLLYFNRVLANLSCSSRCSCSVLW